MKLQTDFFNDFSYKQRSTAEKIEENEMILHLLNNYGYCCFPTSLITAHVVNFLFLELEL